jgi:hypothetical protein
MALTLPAVRIPDSAVFRVHPRTHNYKEALIQAFYAGLKRKPEEPVFQPGNFCRVIRESAWSMGPAHRP